MKAGILASTPGVRGGFRLARPLRPITLMGIVAAIEGPEDAFVCTEIRRHGAAGQVAPGQASRSPCPIATAMRTAELAWREALAAQNWLRPGPGPTAQYLIDPELPKLTRAAT